MSSAEIAAWRQRKAEIIARYGSADAATGPCSREKLLLAAVAPWRQMSEGWTLSIDGWRGDGAAYRGMPPRARRAIEDAYPLPANFSEAKAEGDYWDARNAELRDVLSEDGTFDDEVALDLIAEMRAAIVKDLALCELPVNNVSDLHDRLSMYQAAGGNDPRIMDAVVRDVAAMAGAARNYPSAPKTDAADRIKTALSADPSRSDRDLARELRCSPTTIGRARAAMGLRSSTRAVSRGGRRFEMRVVAATLASPRANCAKE